MTVAANRLLAGFAIVALLSASSADAGSVGDFFKALGNSIAHPGQNKKPPRETADEKASDKGEKRTASRVSAARPPEPPPTPTPTATTSQPPVRPASVPPTKTSKRDIPYAIPVPNKPGFVTSPYAPKSGYVDVRGFPSGAEVKDPYTGKTFLTP